MSDVMELQQNTTGFIQRTKDMLRAQKGRRKPSRLLSVVHGTLASLVPTGTFNWTYATFGERCGISGGSMTNCIAELESKGVVEVQRNGRGKANTYKLMQGVDFQKTYHIRTYLEFYTTEFDITVKTYRKIGKKTKGELLEKRTVCRFLKPAEVDVLSFILTETLLKKGFDGSVKGIADALGMSTRHVERALYALFSAQLVYRPKKEKRTGQSRFVANMDKISKIVKFKEPKKGKKTKKTSKKAVQVQDLNAKADREKYYADLRERAQARADKYIAKASENPRYVAATKALTALELTKAKAELYEPLTLPALLAKEKALREERAAILRTLRIEEWQLLPQYRCKACSDTGFCPSGQACDCYRRE